MTPIPITWTALRSGDACVDGIRAHFPALRAAGIVIPRAYSTLSVDLLALVRVLGVDVALNAAVYAQVDDQRLRLFACDCAERALLREREAGREPDQRSGAAVDVARRYARGAATADELDAADAAAWSAWSAANDAAWAAASDAAAAAVAAASDAACAAWAAWAARSAACATDEREWQTQRLIHYLTTETA